MKINVTSLGCSKNLVDTEVMLAHLAEKGGHLVDEPEEADCLLINTCAFLEEAVEEALDSIMGLARLKKEGLVSRLVVAGCLVSRYGKPLQDEIPEIDAVVPPSSLEAIIEAVFETGQSGDRKQKTEVLDGKPEPDPDSYFPPRIMSQPSHQAYLKVGEGCSNFCTYCMIPSIRGEFVSRKTPSVTEEMKYLLGSGVREITLVAQDTGRFGLDTGEGALPELLEKLVQIPGDYWLRVLYIHPSWITRELLEIMASDPRICRYLDVPFQHVSPRILERMGRGSAPHPGKVMDMVRRYVPDVSFRTTMMTGFPGETEEDSQQMVDFVRKERIDHLGVFSYSREEGTRAALMADQVPRETGEERKHRIMAVQEEISAEKLREFRGSTLEVLVEDADEYGFFGRHQGQAPEVDGVVRLDGEVQAGTFIRVRIVGSGVYDLEGEVV